MDDTPRTRRLKGWHFAKNFLPFLRNTPKYLLIKELDSYCGTIDNTIYAYVYKIYGFTGV